MSAPSGSRRGPLGMSRGDLSAVLWAVACCWLGVWGNYALLGLGLEAAYLVPFDLFAVPLLVSAAFWLAGKAPAWRR